MRRAAINRCVSHLPAHEVVAATDVVVKDGDLQLIGLIVVHVQIKLFQPARVQRLALVLHRGNNVHTHRCNV